MAGYPGYIQDDRKRMLQLQIFTMSLFFNLQTSYFQVDMVRLYYLSQINFHILAIIVFTSQQKVKIVEYCHQTKSFVSIRRMNSFTVEISFTFAEIDKLSVKCNIILEKLFPLYDGF